MFHLRVIFLKLDDGKSSEVKHLHISKLAVPFSVFCKCRRNSPDGGQGDLFDDNKYNLQWIDLSKSDNQSVFSFDLVASYLKTYLTTEAKPSGTKWWK
jgi:hypothetical protein